MLASSVWTKLIHNFAGNLNEKYCVVRGCSVIIHWICLDSLDLISILMWSLKATFSQFYVDSLTISPVKVVHFFSFSNFKF